MKLVKLLLAAAAVGIIVTALRDRETGEWLLPGGSQDDRSRSDRDMNGPEPILGYDGMDQETLLTWLDGADLGRDTLLRIRRYEEANRQREGVLEALEEMIQMV